MANWKKVIVSGSNAVLAQVTASAGFKGDGSALTGVVASSVDIDALSALGGATLHQTQDHFLFSDNGTEKKISFTNLQDSVFADVSGDATIAAGGALTIAADAVEGSMINDNAISGQDEMTGDVADTDELLVSDAGSVKRADFSVVRDAVFADVSGDATIAAGGALTIAANSVALATDTTGDFVGTITAGTGLTSTGATSGENIDHSLSVDASQTQITDVGNLNAGSIRSGFGEINNGDSGITGSFTGSFTGDGSNLTGVTAAVNIDALDALGGTGLSQTDDHFIFSDNGTEKKITFSNLQDAIFADVSSEVTIAAGGAATVANNVIDESNLKTSVAGTGLSGGNGSALDVDLSGESAVTIGAASSTVTIGDKMVITGNLEVRGSHLSVSSSNLLVDDQFALFNSGSTSGDGGIVVQTGASGVGTAFAYDDSAARWGISGVDETAHSATSFAPKQYVVSVSGSGANPTGNPSDFGAAAGDRIGMMHVNTTSGDIFIWS